MFLRADLLTKYAENMTQPSYKNLLKRSRSSVDHVTDREEILQGIVLACKARSVDGNDLLLSSQFWAGKGLKGVSSVSQMAQALTGNSLASKLFFSSGSVKAAALARSPTYPFDSDKALIRLLLAAKRDGEAYSEQMSGSRRRKRSAGHGTDAASHNEATIRTSLLSDESSDACPIASQRLSALEPVFSHAATECPFAEGNLCDKFPHEVVPSVLSVDTPVLHLPEKVGEPSLSLANDIPSTSHHPQVLLETMPSTHTNTEISPLTARRPGCISRDRCPQYGLVSLCGCRRDMEDMCTVEPDLVLLPCDALGGCHCSDSALCACSSFHFFGVYDGHGGKQASSFCKVRLHKVLTDELIKDVRSCKKLPNKPSSDWSSRWRRVMEASFLKVDEEVGGVCPTGACTRVEGNADCCVNPIAPDNVGTTAVVAVIGPCQIIVANCGDSRAVLSRGGMVVPLSRDHKPDREDEMNRITAAGGKIFEWDGYRVGGILAMTRAIGDRYLKNYVVSVPEVMCIERKKEDECLILGSDGLWDVVSSEMACDIARRRLRLQRRKCANSDNPSAEDTPAGAAAALLTKLALSRGSKDNISVIVIDLLKSHCKKRS